MSHHKKDTIAARTAGSSDLESSISDAFTFGNFDIIIDQLAYEMAARPDMQLTFGPKTHLIVTAMASAVKQKNKVITRCLAEERCLIFLPEQKVIVDFEFWANQPEIIRPAYVCPRNHRAQLALYLQNFKETLTLEMDTAKQAGDHNKAELYDMERQFLKNVQEKFQLPTGQAARASLQPILYPPQRHYYPQ